MIYTTKSVFFQNHIIHLSSCDSTNDTLRILSETVRNSTLVVIADEQTQGRGQQGNSWISQAHHNLTFSLLFRPTRLLVEQQFYLNRAVSLAVAEVAQTLTQREVLVKWSNDIYAEGKKIGGILIENKIRQDCVVQSIIGIGLNINQTEHLPPKAQSLKGLCGREIDLAQVFDLLLQNLEKYLQVLDSSNCDVLRVLYLNKLFQHQKIATYRQFRYTNPNDLPEYFEGMIVGVAPNGQLAIGFGKKVYYFAIKEIEFI
jgi:BirA family transcriptional regulator, biotin operon repressor / biotin---[acetyl-CoA-carboxylase] ligase